MPCRDPEVPVDRAAVRRVEEADREEDRAAGMSEEAPDARAEARPMAEDICRPTGLRPRPRHAGPPRPRPRLADLRRHPRRPADPAALERP